MYSSPPPSFGVWELSCVSLTCPHPLWVLLFPRFKLALSHTFWYYKIFQTLMFPASVLESTISPRRLGSFSLSIDIRNQDLYAKYTCYSWSVVASKPFHLTEQGNMCVHIKPCIWTNLYIFLYVTICIYIKLNLSSYWYIQL